MRRVLLLIDARFGIKETDKPFMKQLNEAAVSFQVVLTKGDLVLPNELHKRVTSIAQSLASQGAAHPVIHLTSAHDAMGIAALRASLAVLAVERAERLAGKGSAR